MNKMYKVENSALVPMTEEEVKIYEAEEKKFVKRVMQMWPNLFPCNPQPDPLLDDSDWPCCPVCGEYLDDDPLECPYGG